LDTKELEESRNAHGIRVGVINPNILEVVGKHFTEPPPLETLDEYSRFLDQLGQSGETSDFPPIAFQNDCSFPNSTTACYFSPSDLRAKAWLDSKQLSDLEQFISKPQEKVTISSPSRSTSPSSYLVME